MKKKNLSFMTLLMLTATLIGGCSCDNKSNENVNSLVIKVGNKVYSAKELYNELLSTGTGTNEAFAKVLRLVVEQTMETTANIQGAADLAAESFEEEVKTNAASNGISRDEARKQLLKDKGYESVEQMKSDIIYERKLDLMTTTYWEENKEAYYNEYVANRLPYLIRHVLVKIEDYTNANKIANNVNVSQPEAKKLADVVKDLEQHGDFVETAHLYSEDPGSVGTGGAYYMDNTYGANGFVDEFVYGTYAFDAYTTRTEVDGNVTYTYGPVEDKISKLAGLSDTEAFATYYENGFNFVDMNLFNILGEVDDQTDRNAKDFFSIDNYNQDGTKSTSSMNDTDNYYARSIIFNRAINKPGVSVIGYNTKEEAIAANAKHFVEYKVENDTKYILADENNNAIFFVAARGESNSLWVHFLTINVSALSNLEEAKKFFSISPDYADEDVSYVELMANSESASVRNKYINELESYVKSYVTSGKAGTNGDESILKYDMVRHYITKGNISYMTDQLKNAINSYIDNKKAFAKTNLVNAMADDWNVHTNKLTTSTSDLVQMDVKPYECGVLIPKNNDDQDALRNNVYSVFSTSDRICKYVYGEGYKVRLSYFYEKETSTTSAESFEPVVKDSTNKTLSFTEESNYTEYVSIGKNNDHFILATPKVAAGYVFEGWYTDKNLTQRVPDDHDGDQYVDLSESRYTNDTVFFAKVVKGVSVEYKYVDNTGNKVNPPVSNSNGDRYKYNPDESNHKVNIDLNGFVWPDVAPAKATSIKVARNGQTFNSENLPTELVLAQEDVGTTVTVYVIVTEITGGNE